MEPRDFDTWFASRGGGLDVRKAKVRFTRMLAVHRAARRADRSYNLFAFDRRNGRLIAELFVYIAMRWSMQSGMLGYAVVPDCRRCGYGREAVKAVIRLAFGILGLHRIEAHIAPSNRASIALARSVGLRRERRLRAAYFDHGRWTDMLVFAMNREASRRTGGTPRYGLSLEENVSVAPAHRPLPAKRPARPSESRTKREHTRTNRDSTRPSRGWTRSRRERSRTNFDRVRSNRGRVQRRS
jgi:RimJ/RimL family protein N-acetyltransferase